MYVCVCWCVTVLRMKAITLLTSLIKQKTKNKTKLVMRP